MVTGIIYKIECTETGEVYYGSTTNRYLCNRMAQHKSAFKRYQNGLHEYMTSFYIIERGNYSHSLIETIECDDKKQLEARERFYIENNECINKIIVGRTGKERYEANKEERQEYYKIHYEANKDAIKARVKKYSENNREKVLEKHRIYYAANKEHKKEYDKTYIETNKEKIRQRQRVWREANKARLNVHQRQQRATAKELLNQEQQAR